MVDRFNFYDIYGYFIPGAILLVLLWLPLGFFDIIMPSTMSAVIGIIPSYVLGHLIHSIAKDVIKSKKHTESGEERYFSVIFLDEKNESLSSAVKHKLADLIEKQFELSVADSDEDQKLIDARRNDAFRLCRTYVLQHSEKSYAEQFQGMYVLLRGCSVSLFISAAFYAGFTLIPAIDLYSMDLLKFLISLGLIILGSGYFLLSVFKGLKWCNFKKLWYSIAISFVTGILGGYALVMNYPVGNNIIIVGALMFITILVGARFANESRTYMQWFTATIYRDFIATQQSESFKKI